MVRSLLGKSPICVGLFPFGQKTWKFRYVVLIFLGLHVRPHMQGFYSFVKQISNFVKLKIIYFFLTLFCADAAFANATNCVLENKEMHRQNNLDSIRALFPFLIYRCTYLHTYVRGRVYVYICMSPPPYRAILIF